MEPGIGFLRYRMIVWAHSERELNEKSPLGGLFIEMQVIYLMP
jgi:hypothetical protein